MKRLTTSQLISCMSIRIEAEQTMNAPIDEPRPHLDLRLSGLDGSGTAQEEGMRDENSKIRNLEWFEDGRIQLKGFCARRQAGRSRRGNARVERILRTRARGKEVFKEPPELWLDVKPPLSSLSPFKSTVAGTAVPRIPLVY